jgi:hypothetical protein
MTHLPHLECHECSCRLGAGLDEHKDHCTRDHGVCSMGESPIRCGHDLCAATRDSSQCPFGKCSSRIWSTGQEHVGLCPRDLI